MTQLTHSDLEKMWYRKCAECNAYFKWEHKCDWLMKLLTMLARKNWKELYFTDVTKQDDTN